ncbi:MAG TPA: cellulase family glycosylhydrolase [Candidatus Omnitrophota bacterium]|nr:cellulase family glycosylhydrolase [Candidatus Omnitrophota bacterium]HPT06825.1 cellulase family glycosylhydrolase [Candidatus Omnitrophota bacterium]
MQIKTSCLRGVNLGGWLMMEGYILGGRNIAEQQFKAAFKKRCGKEACAIFERLFRERFIGEQDFKNCAAMGANCVRLPFNCRLIEHNQPGYRYLDNAFRWGEKYNIGIILDMHAAPAAQNCDWHSDSLGRARLWEQEIFRARMIALWEKVVARYKDEKALIGYDLLNEPVLGDTSAALLKKLYQALIRRLKAIDAQHTYFLEGSLWSQRVEFLADILEDNIAVSIHAYQPLQYTFNFVPFQSYPGKIQHEQWDRSAITRYLAGYAEFSRKHSVEIYVGEFGINWRGGYWGECAYLYDMLKAFHAYNFGYTYWTYKAVAQQCFPDGVYQYLKNPAFVRREGPVFGWENYADCWKRARKELIASWDTSAYTANKELIKVLSEFFGSGRKLSS